MRWCRELFVKGGHDLITHWRPYTTYNSDFFKFGFFSALMTGPLHSPCASDRPSGILGKLRLFCRLPRSSRVWTICMENNRLRNENYQNCISIAYFSRYYENDQIFLYYLFEASVSTRNANVHIEHISDEFLSGIFPTAETSLTTTSDVPLSIRNLALMDQCDFLIIFRLSQV